MVKTQGAGAVLCHINLARGFRGGERQTELLVRELAKTSDQRLIVRADGKLRERLCGAPRIKVIGVRGRLAAVRASSGAALIHAHETGAAQAALISSRLYSTPYIITRRTDNVPSRSPFTRAMYRRAATTVALSSAIAGILSGYEPGLPVTNIPDAASDFGHDQQWVQAFRARHSGKFLIGHIAALDDKYKGQHTLIKAAALLEESHPDVHFVLVGSGPDEAELRAAAASLSNLSFTGWADNVGDYLAAFDLFTLPSRHEGMGSILTDAMQFGLPIVATRAGGIPDVVIDGETGMLVDVDAPEALAAAFTELYCNSARRAAMAESSRRHARKYHASLMAERYRKLYDELVPGVAVETEPCEPLDIGATVCHINLARGFRGGERQTELLVRELAKVRDQYVIVRADDELGQRLHGVPGVKTIGVHGRLAAVRASSGASLVHAHETGAAQAALIGNWLFCTPYIITRRTDHVPSRSPFTRYMYRCAKEIVVLSDAIASVLRSYEPSLGVTKIASSVSNLDRDAKWINAFRKRFPGKFLIAHVAALDDRHKDQSSLIKAAASLGKSHPNIHFLLVGSGPDERKLRAAAEKLSNVSFSGWVDNVGDYLEAIDVLALPSRHEGMGSILTDAMQFGLPVVATRVGGIPEVVIDGETGILVPVGDHDALAAAFVKLYADRELFQKMAAASRRRAQNYESSLMAKRYLELYRKLLPRII